MNKSGRYAALTIVLAMTACLGKCGDKRADSGSSEDRAAQNAASTSLISDANKQGAFLPPELADPRYSDENTLPSAAYQLPRADYSKAGTEVEPNNTAATATPIGAALSIRGQIGTGDKDNYVFVTTGEPQLWAIEAVGPSVGGLMAYSAGNDERTPSQKLDSGRMVIPNLYLAAGSHAIEVQPANAPQGAYTLRAIPLGQPDLRMEIEPNDLDSYAQPMRAGISRVGYLLDRVDRDNYSFALHDAARVVLQVTSPPDIRMMLSVSRTNGSPTHTYTSSIKGQNVEMDVTLPGGEYVAMVRPAEGGSQLPYRLRLNIPDPFALTADREPNNDFQHSSPIPPDLTLVGSVGENSDADWYQLPTLNRETTMRMEVVGMSAGLNPRSSVHIINRSNGGNDNVNWTVTDTAWQTKLPANAPLFVQLTGKGDYRIRLAFNPGIPPTTITAPFTVSLPSNTNLIEAFSNLVQRPSLEATVHNPGAQRIQVALDAIVNDIAWTVTPRRQMVTVEPGKDAVVKLQLTVPPDAGAGDAVQLAVRASSPAGSSSATKTFFALCAAAPVNAEVYNPLPPQLLGGLDLAATALGSHPTTTDINNLGREKMLYDGISPSDRAWTGYRINADTALSVAVALGGGRAANIAGVAFVGGIGNPDEQIKAFDVLLSDDGITYKQAMSDSLRPTLAEQSFTFAQPVSARFAQLKVHSNQSTITTGRSTLGEWKVIAAPDEQLSPPSGFNLADPVAGGHVVWSQPLFPSADVVVSEGMKGPLLRLDAAGTNEWVVGFRYDRAAQITRLEWVQPPAIANGGNTLTTVDVAVSTESPVGPWTSVGTWKLTPQPGSVSQLDMPSATWARFVRFSTTEPKKTGDYWRLAEPIRIYEHQIDASYKSILGEWGHYSRAAIRERMMPATNASTSAEISGNNKVGDAIKLESGKQYRGRVLLGEDEDWYKIDVPRDHNRIAVSLRGDPMLRAVAALQDESGKSIAIETSSRSDGTTRVDAIVEGGHSYFLNVTEPPRSIALVWDNSSSIRNFSGPLYRGLAHFVEAVQPKREFVNLMPFQQKPVFLLEKWSDQSHELAGVVRNYNRLDASSNAEASLLGAVEQIENRKGSKAILFITDANSDGYNSTAELWAALSREAPRIFTVELQLGNGADKQQRLMQDWASANDGHYSTFTNSSDIDKAFERTSCYLRRPARFTIAAETRFEELPLPGTLAVTVATPAVSNNAVEIILDASGSMLQMLGSRRKMDIARSTLVDLVEKTLPPKTPFAFRAFGTRLANCQSDLLLRLEPLDRVKVGGMVRKLNATNLAKTPIDASIRAVAEDLKNVKGQKVVVLLTDGEETCGGDPAGAIQFLKQQGLDLRMNIVGFDVDDENLKTSFKRWTAIGGGRYFDAKNGDDLTKALRDALSPKFQVTDGTGRVVGEGTAGSGEVPLPVGTYTVRVLTSPVQTFEKVRIAPKEHHQIEVKGN